MRLGVFSSDSRVLEKWILNERFYSASALDLIYRLQSMAVLTQ